MALVHICEKGNATKELCNGSRKNVTVLNKLHIKVFLGILVDFESSFLCLSQVCQIHRLISLVNFTKMSSLAADTFELNWCFAFSTVYK